MGKTFFRNLVRWIAITALYSTSAAYALDVDCTEPPSMDAGPGNRISLMFSSGGSAYTSFMKEYIDFYFDDKGKLKDIQYNPDEVLLEQTSPTTYEAEIMVYKLYQPKRIKVNCSIELLGD